MNSITELLNLDLHIGNILWVECRLAFRYNLVTLRKRVFCKEFKKGGKNA